jgi:hypothetical protein
VATWHEDVFGERHWTRDPVEKNADQNEQAMKNKVGLIIVSAAAFTLAQCSSEKKDEGMMNAPAPAEQRQDQHPRPPRTNPESTAIGDSRNAIMQPGEANFGNLRSDIAT